MNVPDIMRRSFATIRPDAPLLDAAHLLLETNQRGLPVIDREGHLSALSRRATSCTGPSSVSARRPGISSKNCSASKKIRPLAGECAPVWFVRR
jgi:CBS domain-containing protein